MATLCSLSTWESVILTGYIWIYSVFKRLLCVARINGAHWKKATNYWTGREHTYWEVRVTVLGKIIGLLLTVLMKAVTSFILSIVVEKKWHTINKKKKGQHDIKKTWRRMVLKVTFNITHVFLYICPPTLEGYLKAKNLILNSVWTKHNV